MQISQENLIRLLNNLPGLAYRCLNNKNWTMMFVSEGCYELTGYEMIEPLDVPTEHAYLYIMQANMIYCDKPFMRSVVPKQAAKDAIEMAGIL